MKLRYGQAILLVVLLAACGGCREKPVPPEIDLAWRQEKDLRGAGASVYAPQAHRQYQDELAAARVLLDSERARFLRFGNDDALARTFRDVLARGEHLAEQVRLAREAEAAAIVARMQTLREQLGILRDLSGSLKDRRLATRRLVQAEIRLNEAGRHAAAGRPGEALDRLEVVGEDVRAVLASARPLVARFADPGEIDRWRRMVAEAVEESRRRGSALLVVSKVERRLIWYRRGEKVSNFGVGMGFNFLTPKLHAGDKATPEGLYRVKLKNARSKFYRALLLDYPNDADRRRFASARRSGALPDRVGIGSLIEIHGGGKQGMTDGCVALDNRDMALLFEQIEVGTPVLIVGTTDHDNFISSTLRQLP